MGTEVMGSKVATEGMEVPETKETKAETADEEVLAIMADVGGTVVTASRRVRQARAAKAAKATAAKTGNADKTDVKRKRGRPKLAEKKKRIRPKPLDPEMSERAIAELNRTAQPVGRPTIYDKSFCKLLVEHMSKGFSFESFAGVLRVNGESIKLWAKEHPEFSAAKQIGFELSRLWWEKTGIDGLHCTPQGPNLNANLWRVNMVSRFRKEWQVNTNVNVSGSIEHQLKVLKAMPMEQIIKIGKDAIEYLEAAEGDESNDQ